MFVQNDWFIKPRKVSNKGWIEGRPPNPNNWGDTHWDMILSGGVQLDSQHAEMKGGLSACGGNTYKFRIFVSLLLMAVCVCVLFMSEYAYSMRLEADKELPHALIALFEIVEDL